MSEHNRRSWIIPTPTSLCLICIEFLVLFIPAAINRGPIIFPDLTGYWRSGKAGIDKFAGLFAHRMDNAASDAMFRNAHVVRSAFYSLYAYMTASLSLWILIAIPAIITVFILHLIFLLVCPRQPHWQASLLVILLGLSTTLSWNVSSAMPDVFTAIMVLSLIVNILYWQKLRTVTRGFLLAMITVGVVMHLSNLPIAIGLIASGSVIRWRYFLSQRTRFVMITGAVMVGVFATLAASAAAFKEWTLSPHAPTFMLARSIEDGPGRLYLREHCPEVGLAMCKHLDKLNLSAQDFVWNETKANGLYSVVSPEEQARLRAEDKRIFVDAALEHPWMQLDAMVKNTVVQLFLFTYRDYYVPSYVKFSSSGVETYPSNWANTEKLWTIALDIPEYLVVFVGLIGAANYWRLGTLGRTEKDFCWLILMAIFINAITVTLSTASARYEARIIWLVPMVGLLFMFRSRKAIKTR